MHLKIINEKHYIYIILVFLFIPINFVPQLFDGVIIDYAFKIEDLSGLKHWYIERARQFHLLVILLIDFLKSLKIIKFFNLFFSLISETMLNFFSPLFNFLFL